ncbi:hypothetical protein [Streptomyces sp. NRRL WC-3744]|uniref:hypothetical protein n=1 Tax=Streptomyces sp. NRRL WC-3744 TaxID=1463935 RepID=UPI001F1A5DD2|nr:hypothetical protein [Streptomyces sp. NRRL WC-3744]
MTLARDYADQLAERAAMLGAACPPSRQAGSPTRRPSGPWSPAAPSWSSGCAPGSRTAGSRTSSARTC